MNNFLIFIHFSHFPFFILFIYLLQNLLTKKKLAKVALKCFYKNEVKLLSVLPTISLDKLKRTIKKEFGRRMNIQAKDNDGDLISIKNDKDLSNIIRHAKPPIRFSFNF